MIKKMKCDKEEYGKKKTTTLKTSKRYNNNTNQSRN